MNEHVKEYCEQFIESQENPHYALFIKGDWGTGKTYFINQLLDKYKDEEEDSKANINKSDIVKISLFGVQTSEDIDLKIFQAIHPTLSSKGMKIAGAVLRSAIKFGTNFDLGDLKEVPIFAKGASSLRETKLLVVDDFERALMTPCAIFGYFSELITESETRVIFVGNEEKIAEDDENKKREYLQIKEKTIGMEFQIEPAFDEAIQQFLEEISFQEKSKDEISGIIKEVSSNLGCKNLRTIRQALYNLHLLMNVFNSFEEEDKQKAIIVFLMLFIQKSLNFIDVKTLKGEAANIINIYFNRKLSYKRYSELPSDETKYTDYSKAGHIPLLDFWYSIIFEGNYQKELLTRNYKEEREKIIAQSTSKELSLVKLLNNSYNMDKNTFRETIEEVNKEFESGTYFHPGIILHYANIMLLFSSRKIIEESLDDIQNRVLNFIAKYKEQIVPEPDWGAIQVSYGGYGYNFKAPKFQEIREEMKKLNNEKVLELIKSNIRKDIDSLGANSSEFCSNIRHDGKNEYFQQPILSYVDIDEFYNKLNTVSVDKQEYVLDSFRERYGQIYSNGQLFKEYISDYKNLKKLAEKYTNDNQDCMYNPQAYIKQGIAKGWRELVEYFEKKYPELKSENQQATSQDNSPK